METETTYDAANQLQTALATAGTTNHTFDAAGNQQLSVAPGDERTTNTWNGENRRTKEMLPGGAVGTFAYNGDGLRVLKQDANGTTKFVWDGQRYLLETDANNQSKVRYTVEPTQFGNVIGQRRST